MLVALDQNPAIRGGGGEKEEGWSGGREEVVVVGGGYLHWPVLTQHTMIIAPLLAGVYE